MSLRTISRSAVGGYVKLLRLPFDAALGLRSVNGNHPSGGKIALDRLEARFRSIAGRTLRDDEMVRDANRRRLAADERERAGRLRGEARTRSEHAEQRLSEREKEAARRRSEAARRSASKKRQAERRREAESRGVADLDAKRRRANRKVTARTAEAIEDRSKRARLQQLEEESDALATKRDALAAKDESRRLRQAASKAKAARKRG